MINLINDDFLNTEWNDLPKIDLIVTSPPYNVGIEYDSHNDTMTYKEYLKWSKQWIKKCFSIQPADGRICINVPFSSTPLHLRKQKGDEHINYPITADIINICQSVGYKYYRTIIWKKLGSNKTSWGSWASASAPFVIDPNEAILVFYKKQWKKKKSGTSTISGKEFMLYIKNLWEMQPETRSKHPAAFCLELPNRCIKLLSYKEDTVMDPFVGSGTTGESAVRLGRNFVGIEKSKEYFNMAKQRIDIAELETSLIKEIIPNMPIDLKTDIEECW